MSSDTNKYYRIIEWLGFFITIAILGFAVWVKKEKPELGIKLFLFSLTPFLSIKLFISILEKEAIFSGMPNSVKLADNPKLYWFVISTYCFLITLSLTLTVI